jgi:hypothetical protein
MNADAVLLSHDVCTAMRHTHKVGWIRLTSKASGSPIYSNLHRDSNSTAENVVAACCSHLSRRYRLLKVSFAQNVRMALRCRIGIARPVAHAGPTAQLQVTPAQPMVGSLPVGPSDGGDESPGADGVVSKGVAS